MFIFRDARFFLNENQACATVLVQPSLSLWRSANLDIARATLLSTLCVSDRSRRGAVRILISRAQPSWYFVRVGSLSPRHDAKITPPCWIELILLDSGKEILSQLVFPWRSCASLMVQFSRSVIHEDLDQSFVEVLVRRCDEDPG